MAVGAAGRVRTVEGARGRRAEPSAAPARARRDGARVASPRSGAGGPVLLVVALLALSGLGAWLLVQGTGAPPVAVKAERPRDPARVYTVADAIDHRQMRPVWTLLNMTGLEQICRKARAFTVTRGVEGPAAVPTRFVVYCRDQGFWVVEADPSRERWGTLGPLATREEVEAVIDSEGEFLWGSRPPGQRSFVGGLAGKR